MTFVENKCQFRKDFKQNQHINLIPAFLNTIGRLNPHLGDLCHDTLQAVWNIARNIKKVNDGLVSMELEA